MARRKDTSGTPLVLTGRGQITLPKAVRDRLRLAGGSVLLLREENGRLVLDPAAVTPVETYTDAQIEVWVKADRLAGGERRALRRRWGLSALLLELGAAGRLVVLTSPLAVIEARRNLEVKRPDAVTALDRWLTAVTLVREPSPAVVDRLAPVGLAAKDRPRPRRRAGARATHFVTGDRRDFGRWMDDPGDLPLRVMTPRQFLAEAPPPRRS